jgi:hypothetical protein
MSLVIGGLKMSDDKCPYCDAKVEICHDNGYGYDEGELFEQECGSCGKSFVYETSILILHETFKADCLNGEPHNFKKTNTIPPECATMRCTACDEERPCTKEEMEG